MSDMSLLNELEVKISQMVAALEKEREKNAESKKAIKESQKLSEIEEKIKNAINLLNQLDK